MSSILDALKKLEEEKAARTATPEAEPFEPERAGDALFGRETSKASGRGLSPMAVFVGGALFTLVVVSVSVVAVLWYTRPAPDVMAALEPAPTTPSESAAPVPDVTATDSNPDPVASEALPEPLKTVEPAPEPEPEPPSIVPAAPPPEATRENTAAFVPAPTPTPSPAVEVLSPAPSVPPASAVATPPPAVEAPPAAATPPPGPSAVAQKEAAKPGPLPRDISTLPPLRASDQVRYGLENITIQGLREANANRPYGIAFINMERVYVNEVIPGTRARLIGLNLRGIAIEIVGSGERFFVQQGRL